MNDTLYLIHTIASINLFIMVGWWLAVNIHRELKKQKNQKGA
jgi:hypothetical protein